MLDKVTDFPQYRKLSNNKVYYRIRNDRNFDEIQIIGSKAQLFTIEAQQYPEILRIQDLLNLSMEGFEHSTSVEFDQLLDHYSL
ncbi:MAG: hypothetical protein QNK23_06365 [Crocinitomicaceae bacterium]|nr:hypothetical protein [Crocinitomicaceae bacterium]